MQQDINAIKAAFLKFKKSINDQMDNYTDDLQSAYDMGREQDIIAPTLEALRTKLPIIAASEYEIVHCLYTELEASDSMKEWKCILEKYRTGTLHTQVVTRIANLLTEVAYSDHPLISKYIDKLVADAGFTDEMLSLCGNDSKFAALFV